LVQGLDYILDKQGIVCFPVGTMRFFGLTLDLHRGLSSLLFIGWHVETMPWRKVTRAWNWQPISIYCWG